MRLHGATNTNDEGKVGLLSAAERDALALFLLNVPYPPAQGGHTIMCPVTAPRTVFGFFTSTAMVLGDAMFVVIVIGSPYGEHQSPHHWYGYPDMARAYDRFLILPQGRINMVTLPPFAALAEQGIPERELWRFSWGLREEFDPVWEWCSSTAQVSLVHLRASDLSKQSLADDTTIDLLAALEQSAQEQAIRLVGNGVFLG